MAKWMDRISEILQVGDSVSFKRCFQQSDFTAFSKLSGDRNPLYHDQAYASASQFGKTTVPLHLVAAPLSAVAGMMLPGHRSLYLSTRQRALMPVYYDQEMTYSAKIVAKNADLATLNIQTLVFRGLEVALEAEQIVQIRQDVPSELAPAHDGEVDIRRSGKRTALITGASGAVGRATARALAKKGWNLLLLHRREKKTAMKTLAEQLIGFGSDVTLFECRLEHRKTFSDLTSFMRNHREITDLIHGASPPIDGDGQQLMAVNYTALKMMIQALIPNLLSHQEGTLLFIGSSAVQFAPLGWEDYTAAKAAASHYLTAVQKQYSAYGISSWVLAPGLIRTPFSEPFRSPDDLCLMPEQVAETIVTLLTEQRGKPGGYVWLEPGIGLRMGDFGYYDHREKNRDGNKTATPDSNTPKKSATQVESKTDTATLVRAFFGLNSEADLSRAGVNQHPNWDSLRHIELMLFLEKQLNIRFNSSEIDRTKHFPELDRLIESKIKRL